MVANLFLDTLKIPDITNLNLLNNRLHQPPPHVRRQAQRLPYLQVTHKLVHTKQLLLLVPMAIRKLHNRYMRHFSHDISAETFV
jgi:hypothetical protein